MICWFCGEQSSSAGDIGSRVKRQTQGSLMLQPDPITQQTSQFRLMLICLIGSQNFNKNCSPDICFHASKLTTATDNVAISAYDTKWLTSSDNCSGFDDSKARRSQKSSSFPVFCCRIERFAILSLISRDLQLTCSGFV
jgi:hypothetical protein